MVINFFLIKIIDARCLQQINLSLNLNLRKYQTFNVSLKVSYYIIVLRNSHLKCRSCAYKLFDQIFSSQKGKKTPSKIVWSNCCNNKYVKLHLVLSKHAKFLETLASVGGVAYIYKLLWWTDGRDENNISPPIRGRHNWTKFLLWLYPR